MQIHGNGFDRNLRPHGSVARDLRRQRILEVRELPQREPQWDRRSYPLHLLPARPVAGQPAVSHTRRFSGKVRKS
ncbi:MAG: hypothetical protein ACRD3Y_10355, partial [Bryobacteraceae bacterium]